MKKIISIVLIIAVVIFTIIFVNYRQNVGFEANALGLEEEISLSKNAYVEQPNKPLQTYNITIPDRFIEIAENDDLTLYYEPDTLAIALRVLDNGYVYSSYDFNDTFAGKSTGIVNPIKSGVTLDLYKETTPVSIAYLDTPQVLGSTNQRAAISSYEVTENGMIIHVDYNHPEIMIKFDIHISLNDKTLSYYVPFETIDEYNPNNFDNTKQFYLLRNINLFPYFGSVKSKIDGYVVIPDGSGALVSLEANPKNRVTYSQSVYGSDRGYETLTRSERVRSVKDNQRITLPIYGVIHDVDNTGFLAYIDEGASYADLNFKTAGVVNDYYYTYFSYRYRRTYEQYQSRANENQFRISFSPEKHQFNLKQSFLFLSGDEADYVGVAKSYQQILLDKGLLQESKRKTHQEVPFSVSIVGSDITLGIIQNKALEITSYKHTKELAQALVEDGYESLILRYMTYNMRTDQYEFSRTKTTGSKNDLNDLLEYLDENNIEFSQYYDYVRYYGSKMNYLAQSLSRRQISYRQTSYMFYTHQVVRPSLFASMVSNDIKDLNKYDISSVSLDSLNKGIFTGYDDRMVFRTENISDIQKALDVYEENDISMDIYQPDEYLYRYVSSYLGAPLSSSNYSFTMAAIPLVQLVLSGYVDFYADYLNFMSDTEYSLLRMVEFGLYPSAIITDQSAYVLKKSNMSSIYISDYGLLSSKFRDFYDYMSPGLTETMNQTMVNHQFIAEGVVKVTYSHGVSIIINYTNQDFNYLGKVVGASSYEVII